MRCDTAGSKEGSSSIESSYSSSESPSIFSSGRSALSKTAGGEPNGDNCGYEEGLIRCGSSIGPPWSGAALEEVMGGNEGLRIVMVPMLTRFVEGMDVREVAE
jgi:hypothetical protein